MWGGNPPVGSHTGLRSEKYFQIRRMFFQGTKIHRARIMRHSWCVRPTLRRESTFVSADWYQAAAGGILTAETVCRGRLSFPAYILSPTPYSVCQNFLPIVFFNPPKSPFVKGGL